MAVPDTTPVTVVLPASPIPTVTSLTNIANMDAPRQIPAASARPANQILIAARRRFLVTMVVPQPTPAVSAPLARAIRIATSQTNPAITVVLQQIPAVSALPASLALRWQTRPDVLMGRNPVPTAAEEPDYAVKDIPTAIAVPADTLRPILGEVLPEQLPKFVPVVQLLAPVTGHVCLSLVRYVLKLYQKTAVIPKFLMTVAAEPSLVLFLVHAVWLYRHVQKKDIPAT